MQVSTSPERFVDEADGFPIEQIRPEGSRFEVVNIKRRDEDIEVRARDGVSEDVVEFTASLTDQLHRGVNVDGPQRRRDIDDDLQDLLHIIGYTVVDTDVKRF